MTKLIQVRAALALGVLALIAAPAHQAHAGSCPALITACGCTITDASAHALGNDISAADGLTGKGDCIDINHKNAKLDGFFFDIDGDGSPGVGIRILPGATRASVQNFDAIFGWDVGIEDDANNATITDFDTDDNGTAGVFLRSVDRSVVSDFDSSASSGAGIVLKNSNGNQINDFDTSANGGDGVALNKSERNTIKAFTSDINSGNGVKLTRSTGNSIGDFDADANSADGVLLDKSSRNSIINYTASGNTVDGMLLDAGSNKNRIGDASTNGNGANGVEVGSGDKSNRVFFSTSVSNGGTDLVDGNAGCDRNIWTNLCFDSESQACIGVVAPSC